MNILAAIAKTLAIVKQVMFTLRVVAMVGLNPLFMPRPVLANVNSLFPIALLKL